MIGVCVADALAERGRRVALLERGEIASGCSAGNAGLIVPGFCTPLPGPGAFVEGLRGMLSAEGALAIRPRLDPGLLSWLLRFALACRPAAFRRALRVLRELSLLSRGLFDDWAEELGEESGFQAHGLLVVERREAAWAAAARQLEELRAAGIPAQLLDQAALYEREPGLRAGLAGGIFFPEDAHLDPRALVDRVAERARARGVTIRTGAAVSGFERNGQRLVTVRSRDAEWRADSVVLAAGLWSGDLGRELGLSLPIESGKGLSLTFDAAGPPLRSPLILSEAHLAVTPLPGRLRLAGSLELGCRDDAIMPRRLAALRRAAAAHLEGFDAERTAVAWQGPRPCTPDGLPLLGRAPGYENLWIAAGHAMLGVSLAPATGLLVAQLVCGEPTAADVSALDPARFRR